VKQLESNSANKAQRRPLQLDDLASAAHSIKGVKVVVKEVKI